MRETGVQNKFQLIRQSAAKISLGIAALIAALSVGCATAEKEDTSCTNAECYGVCVGKAWDDLTESYWVFEAYCTDKTTCNCFNYCDDAKCDDFCRTEKSAVSGSCDMLNCMCSGTSVDAGPDKDTGTDSDTGSISDAGPDASL